MHRRSVRWPAGIAAFCLVTFLAHGQVVINEIMYHPYEAWPTNQPAKTTNNSEYVEIYNAGTGVVDLTSYRFDNGIAFDFPAGTLLATGAYLVVCDNVAAFTSYYPNVSNYVGGFAGGLANGGERITLSRQEGDAWVTVDTIEYNDFGRSDGDGPSLELIHPGFARLSDQYTGDWATSSTTNGTPGYRNSVYSATPLPVVGNVLHNPPLPPGNSSIKISARVTGRDGDAMSTVVLKYRKDALSPPGWSTTPMNDTGLNGDVTAGDGIYTVTFPPYGQPAFTSGDILEFQIAATDAIGARTFPFTNTAGVTAGAYSYLCKFGEDAYSDCAYPGEYPTYHILMTAANKAWRENSANLANETLLDCTFVLPDGQVVYNCGMRYRGGSSRNALYGGYRIEFPAGRTYDGFKELNFNYQYARNQFIGMVIQGRAGYDNHASEVQLSRIWVNADLKLDNVDNIYVRLEKFGSEMIGRYFPEPLGNVYVSFGDTWNDTHYNGDLTYFTTLSTYWSQPSGYVGETNNPYTMWHSLSNLCGIVNSPVAEFPQMITNRAAVRQWGRHFATMVALDNREAGIGSPHNCYGDELRLYCDGTTGLFYFFPWDMSDVIGASARIWEWSGVAANRVFGFLSNPPIAPYYVGDTLDLIENVMSDSNMAALFDEMGSKMAPLKAAHLSTIASQRANLRAMVNTNLTVLVNGQALAGDYVTVVATNIPSPNVLYRSQSINGWLDLGSFNFTGLPGENVSVKRTAASGPRATVADVVMFSNATATVIVDNLDAGFSKTGSWMAPLPGGYIGTFERTTNLEATATWATTLPTAGTYRVYAWSKANDITGVGDTNAQYIVSPLENRVSIALSGTAPQTYTAKVLANGIAAAWNTRTGTWSTVENLTSNERSFPVTVEAVSSEGAALRSRSFTVVVERYPQSRSGLISSDTQWTSQQGVIAVTADVTVTAGATLTIASNAVVLFNPGTRIILNSGNLRFAGSSNQPVLLFPRDGASTWTIQASGSSMVTGAYANLTGGRLVVTSAAQLALEDSTLSYYSGANGIVEADSAGSVSLVRCKVSQYATAMFRASPVRIDSCLFEQMSRAGMEFVSAVAPVSVLRTTVERSTGSGSVTGICFTGTSSASVSNALVRTLSGPGLAFSSSAPSLGASLIHDCGTGIAASSSPSAVLRNVTVADCLTGISGVQPAPTNCILWGNGVSAANGPATASYCDLQLPGTNLWPGPGNMNRTPWFRDVQENDFRLLPISPCLSGGSGGSQMGALFPVGASPEPPDNLVLTNATDAQVTLLWQDNSGDETRFEIQRQAAGEAWVSITNLPANATNWTVANLLPEMVYAFRVRAAHERGESYFSNGAEVETAASDRLQELRDYLRITEIMYNPAPPPPGIYGNDDFEYLELKNIGPGTLDLSGLYFSDGIGFTFTNGTLLSAGARFLLVRNAAAFVTRYPGIPVQGVFESGKLDNAGERIRIKDLQDNTVLDITYGDGGDTRWYPTTDGDGYSLVLVDPEGEPDNPTSWRASTHVDGSPGADDPLPPYGTIVINEVLAHQDQENPGDWIELYNAGTNQVDVGYWYLSDDPQVLTNFQIPAGTMILPGGYRVFTEHSNFGTNALGSRGFALSELGDSVYLSSADSSNRLTSYRTYVKFGATANGVTLGRHARSDGVSDFTALLSPTMGATNAYPLVGPLVINEIMYNPSAGGKEFVEVLNISSNALPLFDIARPTNTWVFNGAMEFAFPTNTWLAPQECAVIASVDPAEFRQVTGITNPLVRIFGPFTGALANGGETVKLYKPGPPEPDGFVPFILADKVQYEDHAPWPAMADNDGPSMERINSFAYGNDPVNWMATTIGGSPGASNNTSGLPAVAFAIPDAGGYESNRTISVAILLYPPSTSTTTVHCAAIGGTATAGIDYSYTNTTITFWPYETSKTVDLVIREDSTPSGEPDETVVLGLSLVSGYAVLGGLTQFTYTIIDNDATSIPAPVITPSGSTYFTNSVLVTMSTTVPQGVIRYTTDGSRPVQSSPLYEAPLALTYGARVTARAFLGSFNAGASASALFIAQTPAPISEYWFGVLTNGFGAVSGGNRWVTAGSNVTAVASPDAYSQFAGWSGDTYGAATTSSPTLSVLMDRPRTVTANLTERLAANGTPQRWLASFYTTNDYDSAELSDTDEDGMPAWAEYHADTDPTNAASVLKVVGSGPAAIGFDISWLSRTTRWYTVHRATNMLEGWVHPALTSNVPGSASGTNTLTDGNPPSNGAFYRIGVQWP